MKILALNLEKEYLYLLNVYSILKYLYPLNLGFPLSFIIDLFIYQVVNRCVLCVSLHILCKTIFLCGSYQTTEGLELTCLFTYII